MYYLVQISKNAAGDTAKGTSEYKTQREAWQALYTAMSAALKAGKDTQLISCVIMDEAGNVLKREHFSDMKEED